MDCPSGVNIPVNLAMFNHYSMLKLENPETASFVLQNGYRALQDSERSTNCLACEECLSHCPQKIAIPTELKKISQALASL
jgi:predicted aldo/keto reductase-like oxidoreductase